MEFLLLRSGLKSGEARICKTFPLHGVRAHICYLADEVSGVGVEGKAVWLRSRRASGCGSQNHRVRSRRASPLLSQTMVEIPTVLPEAPLSYCQASWCVYVFVIPLVLWMRSFRTEKWTGLTKAMMVMEPDSKMKSTEAHKAINHNDFGM